uniref:Amine oxidase domain-containing protein n=1 Tax=Cuerna arida TaxID=1464854 RepID=A0A1B6H337_9HEMI
MFSKGIILRPNCLNPNSQQIAVLNVWSPTRNINLLQKCKDCLNALLKSPHQTEKVCNVSESCCSARASEETSPHLGATEVTTQYSANVVIIGAGLAGLSAANHLQENGVDNITVIEACPRPGGRIRSSWFGDSVIELGSAICKPRITNPIVNDLFHDGLTKPLVNNADRSRGLLLRSDGSVIPYPLTFEVYQIFKQIWVLAHEIELEESGRSKHSVVKFLGGRIEQEVRNFPSSHQVDAERVFHGLASMITAKSNHDSSLITSTNFGDFIQLPGSRIKVPLGHFGEINTLYKALPQNKVHFCKSVVKIRWGGVSDVFPRGVVICENGESFPADYIIITIPLGVLKALSDTLFCPGLPASKLDAILKIPVGFNSKIFLEYSQPFWMWNKDFKKATFDAKSMECKKGWLKGVDSVQLVQGSNHIVRVTVAGPQAQCMECLSDREVICDLSDFLKEVFCKKDIPEPVKIKRSGWSCDPCFYGSYTYMGCGVSSKDFYNLASPLPEQTELCDPVLLFAGEATCPVNFGTIKGAKASGIREAERLLQLIRLQQEKEPPCPQLMECSI